jgi:ADP-heptose:LPS heptosyltransferase
LKVGISWFGGKDNETRRRRSVPIATWRDVLATRGAQFISLQYGDTRQLVAGVQREFGTTIHSWDDCDPLREIDDFAALVASLDLVISVDNSTVHLAGAVGTPVWTLLPFASDWRWLLECEDSPWYPSMRLFRQREAGDWTEVMNRVAARLAGGTAGGATDRV